MRKEPISNGTKKKIALKPAHDALQTLLQDLDTVEVAKLPDKEGTTIEDAGEWLKTLKTTRQGLFEWCRSPGGGANQFTLEIQSKR